MIYISAVNKITTISYILAETMLRYLNHLDITMKYPIMNITVHYKLSHMSWSILTRITLPRSGSRRCWWSPTLDCGW